MEDKDRGGTPNPGQGPGVASGQHRDLHDVQHSQPGGGGSLSYARATQKHHQSSLLDLNIVLIKIKRDFEQREIPFDDELCKQALKIAKINHLTDTMGCQYHFRKGIITIELWMKEHVTVVSTDERVELAKGFNLLSVHPKNVREVSLVVIGLPHDVPDQILFEYLKLFGLRNIADKSERLKTKGGMWKDQRNGERRIKVDTSAQIMPMGTYHTILDETVRIVYPGNTKTCRHCHEASVSCPGNAIASKCRQNNGKNVSIEDHMRYLHNELRTVQQLARDEQLHQDNLQTSPQPTLIQADNILNFPPISAAASSV